ncbi:bifunctional aspartate kinase/homoserine dehydrogenase II [Pseudoalteromonas sp. BDTF-M6]|uniref:bifunctional aspartate kinase/homoserine dehydrogenase II n=1 Tax=Pseudoalteromonas sp. BDTF-M6 TaxID=2796132 RepID=UPI001BAF2B29|nr:bifunctional aspartate kinase/homoserine dehydrogenase II [Pseudoalteromonas sp. BDTF-M6]MBS3799112.1 bifunctional aspartate kinase/homoserine dehydrogenase II [Pseudoalteromonas sp. BDTF-M6]
MAKVVHKFGGSSLSSAARYHAVANIILAHSQVGDIVVVSAAGKTTDTLVKLWQAFEQQDLHSGMDVISLLRNHQQELIHELLSGEINAQVLALLEQELTQVWQEFEQGSLHEAALLAHGELWSARLLSSYLQQLGVEAQALDARRLLCAQHGQLLHRVNEQQCQQFIGADKINVITGFIAADQQGQTVTLGRNGSDYSATLLARYMGVEEVCIWTDTQGVFSTDPRKVASAQKYHKICRSQAQLLAALGNPVLHAKTLSPLHGTSIKLSVRSSYESDALGTEVVREGGCKHKHFITTLAQQDVIKVKQLEQGELEQLRRQLQTSLIACDVRGAWHLVVPQQHSAELLHHFGERAQLLESNVNGFALVAPQAQLAKCQQQVLQEVSELNLNGRFTHVGEGYCLQLTDEEIDADSLGYLHQRLLGSQRQLAVVVAGLGNVGEVFVAQFVQQLARLRQHIDVKVVALVRSQGLLFDPCGIDIEQWQAAWEQHAQDYTDEELISRLAQLDYEHKVVIDITASEPFSQLYPQFAKADCHLISANKYAGTAPFAWYQSLKQDLAQRNLQWRYNTSVGAGLPINFALADLQNSGDRVTRVQGVFSGTLSWLCSQYDGSVPFSQLLLAAQELGFTEPDPREDLSGRDVQRKLLILARELGLDLELDDIDLSALMPTQLAAGTWQECQTNLDALDEFVSSRAQQAKAEQKVLRYNADLRIEQGKVEAKVGLVAVPANDPLAGLQPGDNIFVVNSHWYQENGLVIQGPGAGKEVTAAGVHSDLYWLASRLS